MSNVARICESTQRHGNALVLLLLLKTWDGDESPTRDELAELAHISPRQAERDLLKLVEDGEVEKVGRRGQVTRFQIKGLTHMSDESDNALTDMTVEPQTNVSDPAPAQSDVSVESVISDIPLSVPSDTSVRPFDGTEVAPYSAVRTSTDNSQPSVGAAASAPPAAPRSNGRKTHASKADPRTSHPAIVAVFEVTGRRPDKDIYNAIIRALGDDPDGQRLVECFEAWRGMGYRANNYGWVTDWYVNGIPAKALGGKRELTYEPEQNAVVRGNFNRPSVSARTQRQNRNAEALIRGAAERRVAAAGGVRGGGEPVDS